MHVLLHAVLHALLPKLATTLAGSFVGSFVGSSVGSLAGSSVGSFVGVTATAADTSPVQLPVHGLELEPAALVLVAVVSLPLAELVRALVATAFGDATPRAAQRLWRVHRNVHITGTVIVPALLALVGGVVVGWPAAVPVGERALSRTQRLLVALAGPAAHLAIAAVGLAVPGDLGRAIQLVNALSAGLLLVPAPPLPGGAAVAAIVPALGRRGSRWDQLRRTDVTLWALGILAVLVAVHTVLR